ncbi:MAG: urease accessory protein UreH [Candidatus Methylomirabilaceae bacterium]
MGTSVISILVLGFLLGIKHAIETDHVAAVATIASQERSMWRASLVGAVWGIGHTASLLVAGIAVLALRLTIPEQIQLVLEFLVGLMLVGLGVQAIRRAAKAVVIHQHEHEHGGSPSHAHLHVHVGGIQHHGGRAAVPTRSFWIGLMHGLAGSGALTVLVLATVPSLLVGIVYILTFGAGSILGMLGTSALIGLPVALTAGRFGTLHLRLQQVAGLLSIGVGAVLAWETLRSLIG